MAKVIQEGIFRGMPKGGKLHKSAMALLVELHRDNKRTAQDRTELAILDDLKSRVFVST